MARYLKKARVTGAAERDAALTDAEISTCVDNLTSQERHDIEFAQALAPSRPSVRLAEWGKFLVFFLGCWPRSRWRSLAWRRA